MLLPGRADAADMIAAICSGSKRCGAGLGRRRHPNAPIGGAAWPGSSRPQKQGKAAQQVVLGPSALGRARLTAPLVNPIDGDMAVAMFISVAREQCKGMFALFEPDPKLVAVVDIAFDVADQHGAPPIQGCTTSPNMVKSTFA